MTIHRNHGDISFECNNCHDVLDTETASFEAARNLLRRGGWRSVKQFDEWLHFCDKCKDAA